MRAVQPAKKRCLHSSTVEVYKRTRVEKNLQHKFVANSDFRNTYKQSIKETATKKKTEKQSTFHRFYSVTMQLLQFFFNLPCVGNSKIKSGLHFISLCTFLFVYIYSVILKMYRKIISLVHNCH